MRPPELDISHTEQITKDLTVTYSQADDYQLVMMFDPFRPDVMPGSMHSKIATGKRKFTLKLCAAVEARKARLDAG